MAVSQAAVHDTARGASHQPEVAGQGRSIGWWAMIFMIASEVIFFANLIVAYLYLRVRAGQWPPEGVPELELLFPMVNTCILLLSAIPMHGAHMAIRRGDRRGMQIGLVLASALGLIFLGGQAYEYTHAKFTLETGVFGGTFFTLTGFHGAHVAVGIMIMLACLIRSFFKQTFNKEHHFAVEAAAMYWHFVDAVWIIVFAVVYLL